MNDYYRLIRNMLHQGKIREASYRDINKIMLVYDRFEGNYEFKMKFIVKYGILVIITGGTLMVNGIVMLLFWEIINEQHRISMVHSNQKRSRLN